MEKDEQLLARVTVNYLFLAQFETLRASLISLRKRNPGLALSILQAIVEKGGSFEGVLWSSSASSPSHLAWLSVGELLGFGSSSSADPIWRLDPHALKLKVEFLLLVDLIRSRLTSDSETLVRLPQALLQLPELERSPTNDRNDQIDELATNRDDSFERAAVIVCNTISSHGLQRLQTDIHNLECSVSSETFTDVEERCLRRMACDYPMLLDVLCDNIERQQRLYRGYDSKLAISIYDTDSSFREGHVRQKSEDSGGDFKLGLRVQQEVQLGHLDASKESLENDDLETSFGHLRFLHPDYGLPESVYRPIIHDLTRKAKSLSTEKENSWFQAREKMLRIYEEVLASSSMQLTKMVEATQDDLIREEAEQNIASNEGPFPPPLQHLLRSFQALHSGHVSLSRNVSVAEGLAISSCMRELYHYARVYGVHAMDIVMEAALSAVKSERLQEASNAGFNK